MKKRVMVAMPVAYEPPPYRKTTSMGPEQSNRGNAYIDRGEYEPQRGSKLDRKSVV